MDVNSVLLQQGPLVVLMAFIIWTGFKGHWEYGPTARERLKKAEDRCERLEAIVFRQLNISETAVNALNKVEKP